MFMRCTECKSFNQVTPWGDGECKATSTFIESYDACRLKDQEELDICGAGAGYAYNERIIMEMEKEAVGFEAEMERIEKGLEDIGAVVPKEYECFISMYDTESSDFASIGDVVKADGKGYGLVSGYAFDRNGNPCYVCEREGLGSGIVFFVAKEVKKTYYERRARQ